MRRLVRCGTTLVWHLILVGAALQRCGKTYPPPRTERARLQEPALSRAEGCRPDPIRKRALAREDHGRLPPKPFEKDCHPERSCRFAKRSSYVVEGPLYIRHSQRSLKAFSPRLGRRSASRPKTRVETGLAPSQPADQLNLALDFGWRSASALRKDPPFSTNGKGTASAMSPRANKEAGFSP